MFMYKFIVQIAFLTQCSFCEYFFIELLFKETQWLSACVALAEDPGLRSQHPCWGVRQFITTCNPISRGIWHLWPQRYLYTQPFKSNDKIGLLRYLFIGECAYTHTHATWPCDSQRTMPGVGFAVHLIGAEVSLLSLLCCILQAGWFTSFWANLLPQAPSLL